VEACIIAFGSKNVIGRLLIRGVGSRLMSKGWRFIPSSSIKRSRVTKSTTFHAQCMFSSTARSRETHLRSQCPLHQGQDHFLGDIRDSKSRSKTRSCELYNATVSVQGSSGAPRDGTLEKEYNRLTIDPDGSDVPVTLAR
jgi:hypothetical protein